MKSLDDLLRDASADWMLQARPTLVETADELAGQLRPTRWHRLAMGGISVALVVGAAWWLLSQSPMVQEQPRMTVQAQVQAPIATQVQPSRVDEPQSAPSAAPRSPVTDPTAPVESESPTQLMADVTVDGFTAEYERVLARAMLFESTDPLRAASEYLGLGRLCLARQQWAHAASALQRSEELARRGQFLHLMPEIQRQLAVAQQRLRN